MHRLTPQGGFTELAYDELAKFAAVDHDTQMVVCIPLAAAHRQGHNPVHHTCNPLYQYLPWLATPGEGQLIYDVGTHSSADAAGLVARGPLRTGLAADKQRRFICADVVLSDGQRGWLNVAMREERWSDKTRWRVYCKLVVLEKCQCRHCELSWLMRGWRCPEAVSAGFLVAEYPRTEWAAALEAAGATADEATSFSSSYSVTTDSNMTTVQFPLCANQLMDDDTAGPSGDTADVDDTAGGRYHDDVW